jgi:hypothetical protein
MDQTWLNRYKPYLYLALWMIMACACITFWIVESALALSVRRNVTTSVIQTTHMKSLLDTMMMDQIGNTSFESVVVMKTPKNLTEQLKLVEGIKRSLDHMVRNYTAKN